MKNSKKQRVKEKEMRLKHTYNFVSCHELNEEVGVHKRLVFCSQVSGLLREKVMENVWKLKREKMLFGLISKKIIKFIFLNQDLFWLARVALLAFLLDAFAMFNKLNTTLQRKRINTFQNHIIQAKVQI